ncbi:ATP-binding cassette domain-containing protein [candidate division GN15 bacterium]|nr:ATP-binding cassette domain-containing protein [candidate division GN15 bacterium]
MNIIETHDLTKIYHTRLKKGNVRALDEVNLEVRQGEVFGLLGPNGAGKTTLVKALLGITKITSGNALINGYPPNEPASRERVGFLPENHRFPTHLTGLGILEFAGRMVGMKGAQIDQRAGELLELVGMSKWANTKIKKYSKGMAQRIGLAQSMMGDPDIVLLDEPTDGVDPVGKVEIRDVLKNIREQGKTVFINSHLLAEVEAVADRCAILRAGKVIRVGTVSELTTNDSEYVIEADIGNEQFHVPPEIGKRISISAKELRLSLNNPEDINKVIDELRLRKISIKSVMPLKQSLEDSFFRAITEKPEEVS